MPGRSSKPLFELMTGRRSGGVSAPRRTVPRAPQDAAPPGRPATITDEPATCTFKVTTLYLACAVAVTLGVLIYAGGYKLGWNAGKADLARSMGTPGEDEPIRDPIVEASPGSPEPVSITQGAPGVGAAGGPGAERSPLPEPDPPLPARTGGGGSILERGSGPIMTYAGMVETDPRTPGVNYVQLGDLPQDQAVAAIEYLAAHGERAMAIPLERRDRATNNPWYRLFSLETPVPSERFAAMGRERRDHIRRVAEIGQRWRREERGGSDFSSAFYSKYVP